MPKQGLILKKIINFFKLLKRRIDILNAEAELKFILEKYVKGTEIKFQEGVLIPLSRLYCLCFS